MNRFYLFNTWVLLFFIVLTGLFIFASCFYIVQLCRLNSKNKRFKQGLYTNDDRKRNYNQNLRLAAQIAINEVQASADAKHIDQPPLKRAKKTTTKSDGRSQKSSLCFRGLFRSRKNEDKVNSFTEDGYFSQFKSYCADQLDGQAQSYESFETMTTDSECYRDWRHSIDFTNGIPSLNNYNTEIMQKAYEQLYAQKQQSTSPSNRSTKGEISIPVNDLYPVSVVPYDFEPQPLYLYEYQNAFNDTQDLDGSQARQDLYNESGSKLDERMRNYGQGYVSQDRVNRKLNSKEGAQNKLETLVMTQTDGKIRPKLIATSQENNLDRNMNLLSGR